MSVTTTTKLENDLKLVAYQRSHDYYNLSSLFDLERREQAVYAVPTSDMRMADIFTAVFGNKFVYVPEGKTSGTFYAWDGTIWVPVKKQSFGNSLAKACSYFIGSIVSGSPLPTTKGNLGVVLGLIKEQLGEEDSRYKAVAAHYKEARSYAKNLESNSGLSNLEKQLKSKLEVEAGYFDNDSDYIVFADGKVLLTKELDKGFQEPDMNRPVARKLSIASDHQDTQPKAWEVALNNWQPNKDDQRYLQVAAGAALLGQGTAKNVVCIYGRSNTGKSTYARTIAGVFGDYAGTMWPTAIEQAYSTNWEQAEARGKRFLLVEEPSERKTDDTFLKNLSGGGSEVKTQQKGKDPVAWRPQCVLHMTSNVKPNINTGDMAMVNRLNFVEFEHVFEFGQDEAAKEYQDTLVGLAGMAILKWVLEGAKEYEKLQRIPLSDNIVRKAQENVSDNSTAIQWLEELLVNVNFENGCVRLKSDMSMPLTSCMTKADAYKYYRAWCRINEEDIPMRKKDFFNDIKGRMNYANFPKSMGYDRCPGLSLEHKNQDCKTDRCIKNQALFTG